MDTSDLPDMYAQSQGPQARELKAYMSRKSQIPMHVTSNTYVRTYVTPPWQADSTTYNSSKRVQKCYSACIYNVRSLSIWLWV